MKTIAMTILLCCAVWPGKSQHTTFKKTIENRYSAVQTGKDGRHGVDNVSGRDRVEKILLGDTLGIVEFVLEPSFDGAFALRLVQNPSNGKYRLEAVRIVNWKEAQREASEKYPSIGIPAGLAGPNALPKDIEELIGRHNAAMSPLYSDEMLKTFRTETSSIPVSAAFANKLQKSFAALIDGFTAGELDAVVSGDGEKTTFRTTGGNEVRTLAIQPKTEQQARELSDLCKEIIADVEANRLDEGKYARKLE